METIMANFTKAQLVSVIAEKTGEGKASVERFLAAFQETVIEEVAAGNEVRLTGFAAFESRARAARTVRSPRTGEQIEVAATTAVKIRPLTHFRDTVAGK